MSRAVIRGAKDSACAGCVEERAESNAGFERIGARSAVDFDERDSGRNGDGSCGGWVYGRAEAELSGC